jgi:hypothetical protein
MTSAWNYPVKRSGIKPESRSALRQRLGRDGWGTHMTNRPLRGCTSHPLLPSSLLPKCWLVTSVGPPLIEGRASYDCDEYSSRNILQLAYMQPSMKRTVETIGLRTYKETLINLQYDKNWKSNARHPGLRHRCRSAFDGHCSVACNEPTTRRIWLHELEESTCR